MVFYYIGIDNQHDNVIKNNCYYQPMLIDHAEYLLELISDTPQKPGRDPFERYSVLKEQFEKLKESK
ncbi:MAG: hypothetical protein ACQERS_10580 [Bacteroidota bacterium]